MLTEKVCALQELIIVLSYQYNLQKLDLTYLGNSVPCQLFSEEQSGYSKILRQVYQILHRDAIYIKNAPIERFIPTR